MGGITLQAELSPIIEDDASSESLVEKVYRDLKSDIVSCTIAPGATLSESALAKRFQISKTPVREALVQLRSDGYVNTFPRRGYQVTPLTLTDLRELFELRTIVEASAAELAAQRISGEEIQHLRRLATIVYRDTDKQTLQHFVSANREFHGVIAKATRNERLHQLVLHQIDSLERFFYIGAQIRDVNSETETHHHTLVDLLAKQDAQGARKMMIEHNEATRRGLLEAMAQSPYSTLIRS